MVPSAVAPPQGDRTHLRGWKEIGAYLDACGRTVQRWERELKLPVHRAGTIGRPLIIAHRAELDDWLQSIAGRTALAEVNSTVAAVQCPVTDSISSESMQGIDPAGTILPSPQASGSSSWVGTSGSRRRGSRRYLAAVGAILLATLGVVGAKLGRPGFREPGGQSPSQLASDRSATNQRSDATTRAQSVGVRVGFAGGGAGTIGVPVGGIATCEGPDGTSYAISVEIMADGARVHLSRFSKWAGRTVPEVIEVGAWQLRYGETTNIVGQGALATIQLVPSRQPVRAIAK